MQYENSIVARRFVDGRVIWKIPDAKALPSLTCFSSDGQKIAFLLNISSFHEGHVLTIWDLQKSKQNWRPEKIIPIGLLAFKSYDMRFLPDSNVVHLMDEPMPSDNFVTSYDLQSDNLLKRVKFSTYINPEFSPDGSLFADVKNEGSPTNMPVIVGSWPSGEIQRRLDCVVPVTYAYENSHHLLFSADSSTLAAIDSDGIITLRRVQ